MFAFLRKDDDDIVRPVGAEAPAGRSLFGLRQVIGIAVVLALGGGLGTGAYFLSSIEMRDVIGLFDVADQGPRLSMQMPEAGSAPKEEGGGLLKPPQAAGGEAPAAPKEPSPLKDTPPEPEPAAPAAPAAAPPAAPERVAAVTVPEMPTPRPVDRPPTFASLPLQQQSPPLPEAPIRELLGEGKLPVVAADGRQPWKVYARPFEAPKGKAKVAVVVVGLGLDQAATEAAIVRLAPEVSLAFSPYASDLPKWIKKARDAGHEALISLPVEAGSVARDLGPAGLSSAATPEENVGRLEYMLGAAPGVVGVVAPGSSFAGSPAAAGVLAQLFRRGLLYVGDGVGGGRVPHAAAIAQVADQDPWRDAIDARLALALATARSQGSAVVVAGATPVAFDRLVAWMATLDSAVVAAPVSALVKPAGNS
jgi:polysaccharide deacetylase 2 family uncharacterized protein YibQ